MGTKRIMGILLALALSLLCVTGLAESGAEDGEKALTREEILAMVLSFDDQTTEIYLEQGQEATVSLGDQSFRQVESSNAWVARGIINAEDKILTVSAISPGEAWVTLRGENGKRSIRIVASEPSLYTGATNRIAWSITRQGLLTIFGKGEIPALQPGGEWLEYASAVSAIQIREGVTSIGKDAFAGMSQAKSLTLPASMEEIGEAFSGCQIEEVYVEDLAAWLKVKFADSDGDGSYDLTAGPTAKMKKLYEAGTALGNEILVPNGAATIAPAAFYNLKPKLIYLPESLTEIQEHTFEGLKQVTFTVIADSYAETWCKENGYKPKAITLVTGVELSAEEVTINKEKNLTLTAKVTPSKATTKKLAWTSSDPSVATVKDGRINAKENGECIIRATTTDGSGITVECRVTVHQLVRSLGAKPKKFTLAYGSTLVPTLTISPADATNQVVALTSSNEKVCTIDAGGVINAVGAGDCEINCETTDGSNKSLKLKIHVSGFDTVEAWHEVDEKEGLVIPVNFDQLSLENITHQAQDKCFLYYLDQEGIHVLPTAQGQAVISLTSKVNKTDMAKYHITVTKDAIDQTPKGEVGPMYGVATLDRAIANPGNKLKGKFFLSGGKKPYASITYQIAYVRGGETTLGDPVSLKKLSGEFSYKAEDADATYIVFHVTDENGQELSFQSNVTEIVKK